MGPPTSPGPLPLHPPPIRRPLHPARQQVKLFSRNLQAINREELGRAPPPAPPPAAAPSKHQLAKEYGRQVPKPKPREVTVEAPPAPPEEEDELERLERAHEENRRRAAQIRAELLL